MQTTLLAVGILLLGEGLCYLLWRSRQVLLGRLRLIDLPTWIMGLQLIVAIVGLALLVYVNFLREEGIGKSTVASSPTRDPTFSPIPTHYPSSPLPSTYTIVSFLTPTPLTKIDGEMVLDCDSAATGLQENCTYGVNENFGVAVVLTKAPSAGYAATQTLLTWGENGDYLPSLDPATEDPNRICEIHARNDYSDYNPNDRALSYGCINSASRNVHDTGVISQYQFRCIHSGTLVLTLVRDYGLFPATFFTTLDMTSSAYPALRNPVVTCKDFS